MASEKLGPGGLMAAFFDAGAYTPMFEENAGATAGFGMVGGQGAYAVCQKGEALSAADVKVCRRVLKLAAETGNPVVTFYNAPGAKLDDGLKSLTSAKKLAAAAAKLSGVVPQIAVVTGVCGATSAMAAASADLCIMTKDAELFLSAPFLSAAAGDKTAGAGSAASAEKAGVASLVVEDAGEAARQAAKLVMLLPQNNLAETAAFDFNSPVSAFPAKFTAEGAVDALADAGSAVELFAGFGSGVRTYLATFAGNVVGITATAGPDTTMGRHCAAKAARFARLCDGYSIPLVTVINSGGFVVSSQSDEAGMIRAASRLSAIYADATCARVAVLCGRTFGPLYAAMAGADLTIAMQGSVTAPVEPSAAVTVLYKEEIAAAGGSLEAETDKRAKQYEQEVASADALLKAGLADFVADGATLRGTIAAALDILATKRAQRMPKKHGNMPL